MDLLRGFCLLAPVKVWFVKFDSDIYRGTGTRIWFIVMKI